MASKRERDSQQETVDVDELLDQVETTVDRVKVLYEQYFLGIAKQAPSVLHTEVERKLRDLTQANIRNTAQRYRFAAVQQKVSSYNAYWRRTMREIEQGRYIRNLSRMKRSAERDGAEIPPEILAAMPKRMRDQVIKERAAIEEMARRRGAAPNPSGAKRDPNSPSTPTAPSQSVEPRPTSFFLEDEAADVDFDAIFATMEKKSDASLGKSPAHRATTHGGEEARRSRPSSGSFVPHAPIEEPLPDFPRVRRPSSKQTPIPKPAASPDASPQPTHGKPPLHSGLPHLPSIGATNVPANARPSIPPPRPSTPPPRPSLPPPRPPLATASDNKPPPGMSDADVRTLYSKYAKAKELIGEKTDPAAYQKLLKTLHQQAPKILQQYGATSVEFGVTIKDNQVILKAKPK